MEGISVEQNDDGSETITSEILGSGTIKDGVITGGHGTLPTKAWYKLGSILYEDADVDNYCQAIGMLFLQGNLEAIAALRLGWREVGGRDWATEETSETGEGWTGNGQHNPDGEAGIR
jgi:hypothetical protein